MSRVSRLPPANAGDAAARAANKVLSRVVVNFTRMTSSPRRRADTGLDLLPKLGEQQRLGSTAADGARTALQIEGAQVLAGHRLTLDVIGDRELALGKTHDGVAVRHPILRRQEKEHVLLLADLRRGREAHGDRKPAVN